MKQLPGYSYKKVPYTLVEKTRTLSFILTFGQDLAGKTYYEHYQPDQAGDNNDATVLFVRYVTNIYPTDQGPRCDRSTTKDKQYI